MRYEYAAIVIGVFLGILQERYSDAEILRMLQRRRVKEALKVVK